MITEIMTKSVAEDIINRLVKRYGYMTERFDNGLKVLYRGGVVLTANKTNNSLYVVKYSAEAKVFTVK